MKGLTMSIVIFICGVIAGSLISVLAFKFLHIHRHKWGGDGNLLRVGGSRRLMTGAVKRVTQNACTGGDVRPAVKKNSNA